MMAQSWVQMEIGWLLESGTLSPDDEQFLRYIASKCFNDLTYLEIAKLAQIQGKGASR